MTSKFISKILLSGSVLFGASIGCEAINKKSDRPYDSYVVAKQYRANSPV